jgi:hypothetical protein
VRGPPEFAHRKPAVETVLPRERIQLVPSGIHGPADCDGVVRQVDPDRDRAEADCGADQAALTRPHRSIELQRLAVPRMPLAIGADRLRRAHVSARNLMSGVGPKSLRFSANEIMLEGDVAAIRGA